MQLIETKTELDYVQLLASKIRREGVTIKFANILEIKDGQISHTGLVDVPLTEAEQAALDEKLKREAEKKSGA